MTLTVTLTPHLSDTDFSLYCGDALEVLRQLPDQHVHCIVCSPPYYAQRNYGVDGQLGLEKTPGEYVAKLVEVFAEARRVLRNDGLLFVNLGDTYASNWGSGRTASWISKNSGEDEGRGWGVETALPPNQFPTRGNGLKVKDLCGIPWTVALALRDDGWYLRRDIVWCLSGGTWLYARTQKGDMPIMLKDAARLDPRTVKLWNGQRWTQVLGWSRTSRNANELEFVLRSGERIGCTPNHKFPTSRGLLHADEIKIGDMLIRSILPEPDKYKSPIHIGYEAAWFAGLYLAEGSMSGDTIQLSGNSCEEERLKRVRKIVESYGGSVTCTVEGNNQSIRVYGKVLVSLVQEFVSGRTAKNKGFATVCWRYSNEFLRSMLDGYLSGDGHWDEGNRRWRLGFTRNYRLEQDLRTLSARLGFKLTLNPVFVEGFGEKWPAFKGEIRFNKSDHHNVKNSAEIIEIRKSRCREIYDVGVEDEPHLFSLASGILTHNSKPGPMPESVKDRCTTSHEFIFMLSKRPNYYYNQDAIREPYHYDGRKVTTVKGQEGSAQHRNGERWPGIGRNKRSVWEVPTRNYEGAHFATFPEALVEPMILAGCPEGGTVLDCFAGAGTTALVARKLGRKSIGIELSREYCDLAAKRLAQLSLLA